MVREIPGQRRSGIRDSGSGFRVSDFGERLQTDSGFGVRYLDRARERVDAKRLRVAANVVAHLGLGPPQVRAVPHLSSKVEGQFLRVEGFRVLGLRVEGAAQKV